LSDNVFIEAFDLRVRGLLTMVFKLVVVKVGCIAVSPLLDLIFDERAEREDLEVRVVSNGAKMDPSSCKTLIKFLDSVEADLVLLVSPNASLKGPSSIRLWLLEREIPVISISDTPSKKAWEKKDEDGKKILEAQEKEGFIIIPSDSMIGARAEFLDPSEMILYNSDALRVLSIGGVFRGIQFLVGESIEQMKSSKKIVLPRSILTADVAIEYANFTNPYAKAKAYSALTIAESVSSVTSKACFKISDANIYISQVCSGHEMMRAAAILADEARELEKGIDTVYRTPHGSDGRIKKKTKMMEKPK
jgi:methylenetetrahydromethanopterin dehydrogenase